MASFNIFASYSTPDLVAKAKSLAERVTEGREIVSGSGGSKQATYRLADLDRLEGNYDIAIQELQRRANNGDSQVPDWAITAAVQPSQVIQDLRD